MKCRHLRVAVAGLGGDSPLEALFVPGTQAAGDLRRRHRQTMNFLHEGPTDARALAEALGPF